MDKGGRRAHASALALGVLLVAACAVNPALRYASVTAATLVPLVVLVVQLVRRTCTNRTAWLVMALGLALVAVHNAQNQVAIATSGALASGVAAAATLVLGYTALLVGAVLALVPKAGPDLGGMTDAALIGLAAASLLWGLLLGPAHVRLGAGPARMTYELVLVLLVSALTGGVARAAVSTPQARAACLLLVVATLAVNVGAVTLTLFQDPATGQTPWWASVPCIVALLAYAAALAHPSVRAVGSVQSPLGGLTRAHLVFLGGALAVNPLLAAAEVAFGAPVDALLLAVSGLLVVPLVLLRIGLLSRWHVEAERRLLALATHDELTGLANRRALTRHLEALLDRVADGTSPGAVVAYLDLDGFKAVNDTFGHGVGDQLLRAVAERVAPFGDSDDAVARLGGDEFVLVLDAAPPRAPALVAALKDALADPVRVGEVVLSTRASIGVAVVAPGEHADAATLLNRADGQMYAVKRVRREQAPADA